MGKGKKIVLLMAALLLCLTLTCAVAEIGSGTVIDDGKSHIWDLKGMTVTLTAPVWIQNGTLTVKNGTIESTDDAFVVGKKYSSGANSIGATHLIIEDSVTINVTGDNCNCVYINGTPYQASVTTAGTLKSENGAAIQGNGNAEYGDVKVTGGSVTSTNDVAIFNPQNSTVAISGGYVVGLVGIEMRAGTLNVSGNAKIDTNGTQEAWSYENGNGSSCRNAAIALSPHNTRKSIKLNISGDAEVSGNVHAAAIYAVNTDEANTTSKVTVSIQDGYIDGVVEADMGDSQIVFDTQGGAYTKDPSEFATSDVLAYVREGNTMIWVYLLNQGSVQEVVDYLAAESGISQIEVAVLKGQVELEVASDVDLKVAAKGEAGITVHTENGTIIVDENSGGLVETVAMTDESGEVYTNDCVYEGTEDIVLKSTATFEEFRSVQVMAADGSGEMLAYVGVDEHGELFGDLDKVEVTAGSIKVTLKESFLATLPKGIYTMVIQSEHGSVSGDFKVEQKAATANQIAELPKTGDGSTLLLWVGLMAVSAACLTIMKKKVFND